MRPLSIGVSVGVLYYVGSLVPSPFIARGKDTGRETTSLAPATTFAFGEVAVLGIR